MVQTYKGILVYVNAITRFKSYQFWGHNTETQKISLHHKYRDNVFHPFPAQWQVLALNPMR